MVWESGSVGRVEEGGQRGIRAIRHYNNNKKDEDIADDDDDADPYEEIDDDADYHVDSSSSGKRVYHSRRGWNIYATSLIRCILVWIYSTWDSLAYTLNRFGGFFLLFFLKMAFFFL